MAGRSHPGLQAFGKRPVAGVRGIPTTIENRDGWADAAEPPPRPHNGREVGMMGAPTALPVIGLRESVGRPWTGPGTLSAVVRGAGSLGG